jgi:parallel beta-helix repeat protein
MPARLTILPAPAELVLVPGPSVTHYVILGSPFAPATLLLRNPGGSPLEYSLGTPDEPWLGLPSASSGSVAAGGEALLAFPIVDESLPMGEYAADLTLTTNAFGDELVPLTIRLVVVDEFTVTTLADSGPGSLRQIIQNANETPGSQVITFAVEGVIELESELPALNDPTGGTSINGGRRVFLQGSRLRGLENGLVIESAGNVISGMGIIQFPANGILVTGEEARQNLIILCLIGTDGQKDFGNFQSGVRLDGGSSETTIGGDNDVGNIISGNSFSAISVGRSSGNIIRGNNLGVGQRGNEALGNGGHGFHILPTLNSNNMIGGNVLFDSNVIAGNRFSGGTVDVLVGRTVRLRALVHGNEEPDFQWHNESGPFGSPGRELVIPNIQKAQGGAYYCVVSNSAGEVESKRTFLNVLDRKQLAALSLIPAYASLDTNGDGVLTFEELIETVNKALASAAKGVAGLTQEEFEELDLNGDGGLSYQELLAGGAIPLEDVRYEVSPVLHLYPPVDIDEGSAGTQLFTLSNLETESLEVLTTPTLTGVAAGEFAIVGGSGADTLTALQERTIEVGLDPDFLNERVAYLTIRTDDFLLPTYHVLLSGFGVQSTNELLDTLLGRDAPPRQRGELDVNEDHGFDAADILRNALNGL